LSERIFSVMGFQHACEFVYLSNLAESAFIRVHSRFPKLPRRILRLKVILFSALPIQTIGQAALPDLRCGFEFLSANRLAQILTI
jgi:hypothetical protein